jgi:heat shock protein HslJ
MKGQNNVLREILVIVIASVLMAMVMSVGSATELSASNFSLEGNTWTLTAFIKGDDVQSPILNTTITAHFEAGEITGNAGCNNYFGSHMVDVNEITIGALGSTMMTCEPEEVMQQEYQYLEMLGNVTTYAIEGNQLTLSTDDGSDLEYNATELPAPKFHLEGNIWTLTAFIEGDAVQSPILNTTITAYFEAGEINGSAGCNNYIGSYMVDVNEITIGELAVTMMYCGQEGVMQQETQYLEMLGKVTTYAIEGNQLTLSMDDGSDLEYNATELPAPEFSLERNTWMLTSFIAAQITAGADDGFAARSPELFRNDSTGIVIGTDLKFAALLSFSNVTIPENATITRAYITVVPIVTNQVGPLVNISAADDANPSAPTSSSDCYARKRTASPVSWNASLWYAGESENSTDISNVIQELVDSYDYSSGAPLLIFLDTVKQGTDGRNQYFAAYEQTGYESAKLHIEYEYTTEGEEHPLGASFTYSPEKPVIDQTVTFDASSSYDPDGYITNYEWDFDDGNITNTEEEIITHSYSLAGEYMVKLTVTDNSSLTNSTTKGIKVNFFPCLSEEGFEIDCYACHRANQSIQFPCLYEEDFEIDCYACHRANLGP